MCAWVCALDALARLIRFLSSISLYSSIPPTVVSSYLSFYPYCPIALLPKAVLPRFTGFCHATPNTGYAGRSSRVGLVCPLTDGP